MEETTKHDPVIIARMLASAIPAFLRVPRGVVVQGRRRKPAKLLDALRLVAGNLSNKEIASALDLSVQTVKWHLKNLFGKLNAGSRRHLVDRARILGIIDR